jgi:8-oxo-dGTP pyrophosphatase MutT (NUDIX family)
MLAIRARSVFGPRITRLMHVYWRFSRGVTLGIRAVVLNERGEVFLVQHSYVPGWHLPGGGVEPGETVAQALGRELMEEGNIALSNPASLHALYFNNRASNRDYVALFVVRQFQQHEAPRPNREIVAHGFFAPDALPAGTTEATARRIAEVLAGEPPASVW